MSKPKNQTIATTLAFSGVMIPGLHKFYVNQRLWGILYLLFWWTTIPTVASVIEGVWYLSQDRDEFDEKFNLDSLPASYQTVTVKPETITAIADALRQLDSLRQEGLISEYEFEQKRRQLLDHG